MALWLVRAGKHGEQENFALDKDVVVYGWTIEKDLKAIASKQDIEALMFVENPSAKPKAITTWANQAWAFIHKMKTRDLVALPLKQRSAIAIGRVTGDYEFKKDNPPDARHTRAVKWIQKDIPRSKFDQDILYSLGAFLTVGQVQRNNAEERVRALVEGRKIAAPKVIDEQEVIVSEDTEIADLEEYARDQIRDFISHKFKGHSLSNLVAEILLTQGYKVQVSPPGADGGVDIIAGRGQMGFDAPRLAVQVKSSDDPQDVKVLRELQGVMKNFGAEHGLIVSWGGYRQSVFREASRLFFEIRLWDADDLVKALQTNYDQLSDSMQAELPLKRVWMLVNEDQ
jgi:restriction system protein